MKTFFIWILVIGYIIAGSSTIVAGGYGLYLWGSVGLAINVSAWTAFVLWVKMLIVGLIMVALGLWKGL